MSNNQDSVFSSEVSDSTTDNQLSWQKEIEAQIKRQTAQSEKEIEGVEEVEIDSDYNIRTGVAALMLLGALLLVGSSVEAGGMPRQMSAVGQSVAGIYEKTFNTYQAGFSFISNHTIQNVVKLQKQLRSTYKTAEDENIHTQVRTKDGLRIARNSFVDGFNSLRESTRHTIGSSLSDHFDKLVVANEGVLNSEKLKGSANFAYLFISSMPEGINHVRNQVYNKYLTALGYYDAYYVKSKNLLIGSLVEKLNQGALALREIDKNDLHNTINITNVFSGVASSFDDKRSEGIRQDRPEPQIVVVGSPSNPSGITIYDQQTGEPYCITISAGNIVHVAGECKLVLSVR